jgi:hypothetical protein
MTVALLPDAAIARGADRLGQAVYEQLMDIYRAAIERVKVRK